jgi:flagellar hook-length control protein FliK
VIDKTIGVIPPRNELSSFPEKKAENSKDQKSEFESLLNQSSRQSKKSDKKERSDQALGGTKKKVQDTDQKLADKSEKTKNEDNETETDGVDKKRTKKLVNEEMVLSSMASIESANKTPDAEVIPDNLENTSLEISSLEAKPVETATPQAPSPEMNQISDEALAALFDAEQPMSAMSDEALDALSAQLAQVQESIAPTEVQPQIDVTIQAVPVEPLALQESVDPTIQLTPQTQVPTEKQILEVPVQPQVVAQAEVPVQPQVVAQAEVPVQPQVVAQAEAPVQPQVVAQAETPVQPQVVAKTTTEVVPEVLVSKLVPDSKVLETLNREQMFQKLETMKKTEDPAAKTEARNTTNGISIIQNQVVTEASNSFQSADQGQDDLKGDDKDAVQLGAQNHQQSHVAKDFSAVAQATVNKPEDTQAADEAGLKEILNQAQYLVTKGGGEVTVKMSPDGMGEVQLKMMLVNGKMSLEMNTHDKNVQKLIQDSLSDLKSSLAAHQISVEHVTLNNKISTVQDAQNAQSSQNFTDAHAHQQPQHSHQRDQRQQARQVFEHETMKAIPLAKNEINKASAHRVYQTNKANSLNAVA